MTSPTAATPASEDIAKMLDRLEYVCDGHKHDADICECRSLARSRILDLFARLRSDNERQTEALEMFRDEQQRDKANLLTPEEAKEVLWHIEGGIHLHFTDADHDALVAKLRATET